MSTLQTGDIILFTGKKMVRAIGEVGYSFRNASFADSLWDPHSDRGSYHNVYSLLSFTPTAIPYEEIWELPGFNTGDNFMGLRFLNADKSVTIIDGLGIETATVQHSTLQQERQLETLLLEGAKLVDPEAVDTESTTYDRTAATLVIRRAEALLVKEYRATLEGMKVNRIRTQAGITDLYVAGSEGVDIVEAKRDSTHPFVRQALGQLLDYVVHSPEPVTCLTALCSRAAPSPPTSPSFTDTALTAFTVRRPRPSLGSKRLPHGAIT